MTTFNENEHPRAGSGQFTAKTGSEPDVRLLPDIQAPDISELAEMTPEQHRAVAQHNFNFNFNREFQGSDAKAAEFASAAVPRPQGVAGRGHWAYRSYQGEVRNVFGDALREEHGMTDEEEHKRLFDKAWDYGHDSGFYGVEQEYINLVTSDEEKEGTE